MTLSLSKGQHGQTFQQLHGAEPQVGRPIRPPALEREQDVAVVQEAEPLVRQRGPQHIPTQALETVPLVRAPPDPRLEVEPVLAGVTARERAGAAVIERLLSGAESVVSEVLAKRVEKEGHDRSATGLACSARGSVGMGYRFDG